MQNFKNQLHDKHSFTDYIRMERLLSVLDEETKGAVLSIDRSSHFYPTPLTMLKSNFGNLMVSIKILIKISIKICNNVVKLKANY